MFAVKENEPSCYPHGCTGLSAPNKKAALRLIRLASGLLLHLLIGPPVPAWELFQPIGDFIQGLFGSEVSQLLHSVEPAPRSTERQNR
jgi:hypothetical protein